MVEYNLTYVTLPYNILMATENNLPRTACFSVQNYRENKKRASQTG